MKDRVCIVGLDEAEAAEIADVLDVPVMIHLTIPRLLVQQGVLYVESTRGNRMLPVTQMVFHGIYDDDFDFITGLAFWGGACLPNPRAMLDLRLKLPGLLRALEVSRFPARRGFASPGVHVQSDGTLAVAKWGNWHCGENKARFTDAWQGDEPAVIEPFFAGQAVRVAMIGEVCWQIKLDGNDWLKSIHHDDASFMPVDEELLADTRAIRDHFNMEIIANDYIVGEDGQKYLLEVNHIPNVTRFTEMWSAYRDYTTTWLQASLSE